MSESYGSSPASVGSTNARPERIEKMMNDVSDTLRNRVEFQAHNSSPSSEGTKEYMEVEESSELWESYGSSYG